MASSRRGSLNASGSDDGEDGPSYVEMVGGAKTIGLVGGVALLINNITGSGMVLFPSLYQQAGWFIVTLALVFVGALSYICSLMLVESMAAMPGNYNDKGDEFVQRVEYSSLARYYLPGRHSYMVAQLFFQLSLLCNNISGIIQSVQVMDFAIAAVAGKSCAIPEFYPHFSFHCPDPVDNHITVFGNDIYLLSLGFILTALVCIPFGFWNLDDNIVIQKGSCLAVIGMVLAWVGLCGNTHWHLESWRVPTIGDSLSPVLGTVVFNFAIITSIPSWVNEKRPDVSIRKTLHISMLIALALFTMIGIVCGMAFDPWYNTDESDQTLLNKLRQSSSDLAKVTFYLFPVVVNLTSIPVFSIMQRYNLVEEKVCGKKMANFIGVVLPWLMCIPFYTGSGFESVVNWGGIIFNSVVNFIIPPIIYIRMVRAQRGLIVLGSISSSSTSDLLTAPSVVGQDGWKVEVDGAAVMQPTTNINVSSSSSPSTPGAPSSASSTKSGMKQGLLIHEHGLGEGAYELKDPVGARSESSTTPGALRDDDGEGEFGVDDTIMVASNGEELTAVPRVLLRFREHIGYGLSITFLIITLTVIAYSIKDGAQ